MKPFLYDYISLSTHIKQLQQVLDKLLDALLLLVSPN